MKKYYFALFIFFILIYVMPNLMLGILPQEAQAATQAYCAYKYEAFTLSNLDNIISGFFISLFGFTKWGIASNGIIALAVLSLSTIYAIKKCTNDNTLAAFTYLLFFSSFWIFLFIPDAVVGNSGIWGALINFLGLGAYFMASREERFSFQRIGLLLLCGILTFASLLISGLNPFFFSIIVATLYMLSQKRYIDMLLMPIEIIIVTGALLSLSSYCGQGNFFAWVCDGKVSILNYWTEFFSDIPKAQDTIINNLMLLGMGILPIAPFLLCSIRNYKKTSVEFLRRPIYKFSMIFLLTAVIFSILNRGLIMANLPITYLPFSFLVATGLVTYLRSNNRHKLLSSCFVIIGVIAVLLGTNLLLLDNHYFLSGVILIIIGLMLIFTVKLNIEKRIAVYFFSLSLFMLIAALQIAFMADKYFPTARQINKRIETIVGKNYPDNQVQFFACSLNNYHLINFHLQNKVELINDEMANKITDNKRVISSAKFAELLKNNHREFIVFSDSSATKATEFEWLKQAKIMQFDNFTIYYFE